MPEQELKINKAAYEALLPRLKSSRAQKVLRHILDFGRISTYEIEQLGYGHPPRAAQDLKDAGVPLKTVRSAHPITGNRMGTYILATAEPTTDANSGGRAGLTKPQMDRIYQEYGEVCNLDSFDHGRRALQVDHRVQYIVGGDPPGFDVADWQPLCGSHQRLKSFECERCPNIARKEVAVCRTCYWASPEAYEHIATRRERRVDLTWGERDMATFSALAARAAQSGLSLPAIIKQIVEAAVGPAQRD